MSVIDKIKLDGTTYDVGKTPDTTLAVSGSPADAAKVGTELSKKVDKVTGKGLSTEDFTTAEKTKLAGIAEGATNIVIDPTLTQSGQAADAKKTGDEINSLKEDFGFLDSFDASKSGTTGGTYGQFTLNVNRAISANSQYIINMEMTGATFKDCTVYGIISAGSYSDPLLVFTELDKNFVFTASAQYTGFYLYINANETSQAYSAEFHFTQIDSRNQMIDISELQADVDYLNENAVTLFEAVDFATGSVVEYSNTGTGNNWSSTSTGLVISAPITNAVKLINVAVNATENSSFYFGLLTKSENTGTVKFVKQVSVQTGNNPVTVNFDLDPTETYYPFIRMVSGKVTFAPNSYEQNYYSFSKSGTIAVNNTVSLTTASGNGLYIIKCEVLYATAKGGFGNTLTVAKTGGDYQTISEAVAYAKTIASVDNPITIVIYPGIYDEVVNIGKNKYISLVGVNRDTCIIRDQSGKYANSPLLINGTFTIENLTIIANHDNAGSWYPTWVVGQNSTFASYCVHADGGIGTAENPQYGHFINCTFYSECNHAVGTGIHPYQTLCFENCEFVRYVTDSNYLNEGYQGAMGCHSEVTGAVETEAEEHLILKNCEFAFNGDKALQLWHYHAGSPMTVTAIGCTLEDGTGTSNVVYYRRGTKADYLTKKCHGNNTDELNYSAS